MSLDYSSTALIANVKRRCTTPTSQSLFQSTDFCALLSDEMQSYMVPIIMSAKEDYFLSYKDYSIDGTTTDFQIPDRAIGGTIRNVDYYDPNASSHYTPVRVDVGDLGSPMNYVDVGGYYVQDNHIIFQSAPTDTSKYIRMYYYRRPNNIVSRTQAGKITAINTVTKTVSLDYAPTTWTTSLTFDLVRGNGGFQSLGDDLVITAINGFDITFSATLPTTLAVGDFMGESGEAPVAQIPYEGHHVLCQAVAVKVLEALSDPNMIKFAQSKLDELAKKFLGLIKDRVSNQNKKIISRKGIFECISARNSRY